MFLMSLLCSTQCAEQFPHIGSLNMIINLKRQVALCPFVRCRNLDLGRVSNLSKATCVVINEGGKQILQAQDVGVQGQLC